MVEMVAQEETNGHGPWAEDTGHGGHSDHGAGHGGHGDHGEAGACACCVDPRELMVFACLNPVCGSPSWNGRPDQWCSLACKSEGDEAVRVSEQLPDGKFECLGLACSKPSWNGLVNDWCSSSCKRAGGGYERVLKLHNGWYACVNAKCKNPSWNRGAYDWCSTVCRDSAGAIEMAIKEKSVNHGGYGGHGGGHSGGHGMGHGSYAQEECWDASCCAPEVAQNKAVGEICVTKGNQWGFNL